MLRKQYSLRQIWRATVAKSGFIIDSGHILKIITLSQISLSSKSQISSYHVMFISDTSTISRSALSLITHKIGISQIFIPSPNWAKRRFVFHHIQRLILPPVRFHHLCHDRQCDFLRRLRTDIQADGCVQTG